MVSCPSAIPRGWCSKKALTDVIPSTLNLAASRDLRNKSMFFINPVSLRYFDTVAPNGLRQYLFKKI
jgi:hypothetical protein